MTNCKSLTAAGVVIGLMTSVPTLAIAESRAALNIADHDGIYVDGRSFKVVPGTANGDAAALIARSGARELGPAAIVFRKGDKLYLATAPLDRQSFGSDRRDYGSDRDENPSTAQSEREWREWQQSQRQGNGRRDYGSDRDENPSTAQSEREWREWQQSQRQSNNRRAYGSDRRDYGSDREENPSTAQSEREWREWQQSQRRSNPRRDYASDRYATGLNQQTARVDDPEYAQYKLKRFFDENWNASDTR
jgi:hypothetical protein